MAPFDEWRVLSPRNIGKGLVVQNDVASNVNKPNDTARLALAFACLLVQSLCSATGNDSSKRVGKDYNIFLLLNKRKKDVAK
ncbi:hypothetical protein SLS64_003642 [Diaporthe eres]|uniref:Uncharacterized protein n=1 Tax=Diaporthe eres TaxID=83184 RepID=A0ABR1NRF0_DIAER